MKTQVLLFAMMPVAAWAARFAPPEFADTEASTNIAFSAGAQTTYFNPDWNMARLVVRGTNAANEIVRSAVSSNPFSVSIQ